MFLCNEYRSVELQTKKIECFFFTTQSCADDNKTN